MCKNLTSLKVIHDFNKECFDFCCRWTIAIYRFGFNCSEQLSSLLEELIDDRSPEIGSFWFVKHIFLSVYHVLFFSGLTFVLWFLVFKFSPFILIEIARFSWIIIAYIDNVSNNIYSLLPFLSFNTPLRLFNTPLKLFPLNAPFWNWLYFGVSAGFSIGVYVGLSKANQESGFSTILKNFKKISICSWVLFSTYLLLGEPYLPNTLKLVFAPAYIIIIVPVRLVQLLLFSTQIIVVFSWLVIALLSWLILVFIDYLAMKILIFGEHSLWLGWAVLGGGIGVFYGRVHNFVKVRGIKGLKQLLTSFKFWLILSGNSIVTLLFISILLFIWRQVASSEFLNMHLWKYFQEILERIS